MNLFFRFKNWQIKKFICGLVCCFLTNLVFAQKVVCIELGIKNAQNSFAITQWNKLNDEDSIKVVSLRFFISGIKLYQGNNLVYVEPNSYHLIQFPSLVDPKIELKMPNNVRFDQLKFFIGIDSLTNVSGALGADLDPSTGMYWTWQNGYINVKIEAFSNLGSNRNYEIQLHLGGYSYPNNSLQAISFHTSLENISLELDLKAFFQSFPLNETNQVMSPSIKAIELSTKFASFIRLTEK